MKLIVNGGVRMVEDNAETPLLWVLRDELELTGTKFGCYVRIFCAVQKVAQESVVQQFVESAT